MDCKTALPPRKRAKTDEEKEQRRIERILRNRRAAHASREKKRRYVEYLESYIDKLTSNLSSYQYNQEYLMSKIDDLSKSEVESNLKLIEDLKSFESDFFLNGKSSKKFDKANAEDNHEVEQLVSPPVSEVEVNSSTKSSSTPSVKHELDLSQIESAMSSNSSVSGADDEMFDNNNQLFSDHPFDSNDSIETDSSFDSNFLLKPIDNYLSPVSINSPVNSPINLSLYDSNLNDLEHNSEVVVD